MQQAGQIIGYGFSEDEIRKLCQILDKTGWQCNFLNRGELTKDNNLNRERERLAVAIYRKCASQEGKKVLESFVDVPVILLVEKFEESVVLDGLQQGFARVVTWEGLEQAFSDLWRAMETPSEFTLGSPEGVDLASWFREVAEGTDNIIFIMDADWTILYVNPICANMFGFDRQKVIGREIQWNKLVEFDEKASALLKRTLAERKTTRFFSELNTTLGPRWLDVSLIPLVLPGRETVNVMAIGRDVTELKRTELSLLEAKELLVRLMQVSPVVIYSSMPQYPFKVYYMSENVYARTGYSAEEFIGHPGFWMSKTHPDDRPKALAGLERLETQSSTLLEYRMKFSDDQYHYIHDEIKVVYDADGKPVEGMGYFLEVTEQVKAAEEVLRSEIRYRSLAEASHDIIFEISPDSQLKYLNSFARNALGLLEHDLYLQNPEKLGELVRDDLIQQILRTGKPLYAEYRADLNRKSVWLGTWLVPVKDPALKIDSIMGVARDITDRRRIEENLQLALSAEREINDLRYRLLTMTTHEFKTPLSTILSSAELLESYGDHWTRDKQVEHIQRIAKAATRVVNMLDQILEVNQQYYNRQALISEEFNIAGLCNEVIRDIHNSDKEGHNIILSIHGDVQIVNLDKKTVRSILENLLSNAVKYSPAGSDVVLEFGCESDEIRISIRDRGIGISDADRRDLYEPFYRSKAVNRIQGSGLGLTIVKKSVELLDGTIDFRPREGGGTDFIVSLPLLPKVNG